MNEEIVKTIWTHNLLEFVTEEEFVEGEVTVTSTHLYP